MPSKAKWWNPKGNDAKAVETIYKMCHDVLLGRGVDTRETFVGNLRMFIDLIEQQSCPQHQQERGSSLRS